jgi:hypothetical protein
MGLLDDTAEQLAQVELLEFEIFSQDSSRPHTIVFLFVVLLSTPQ